MYKLIWIILATISTASLILALANMYVGEEYLYLSITTVITAIGALIVLHLWSKSILGKYKVTEVDEHELIALGLKNQFKK